MSGNQLQTRNERQTLRSLSVCERMHYGVSVQWMKKNPCLSELYANYSPSYWPHLSRIGDGAYTRVCPALGALDDLYATRGAAATWVQAQVTAMYVASGSRDGTMANAITVFSENFANVAAAYKLTELMLFSRAMPLACTTTATRPSAQDVSALPSTKNFSHSATRLLRRLNARMARGR